MEEKRFMEYVMYCILIQYISSKHFFFGETEPAWESSSRFCSNIVVIIIGRRQGRRGEEEEER